MIAAGQSIGNYRILSKIGTGGMGAVYLAEHPLIGKRVALKVIHRELSGNREVVSRFYQEARAVNQVGNDHIVKIHDFGVSPEGDHFYIMEYLDGRTLASVLAGGQPLDGMRALRVGAQIASALAAVHAAGVIHRDLKPDNIMLLSRFGEQDFVKVLDFGLAKVSSTGPVVNTAAGVLLGTPQYMSPEACESRRDIDHRTDIYALGVLLFQMLTGVLPFDGETMGEVLVKQVTTLPPAPRALNPAIPPSVEQIVLRCLAKPVDARFPTMPVLRDALLDPEAYVRGSPPIAPARSIGSSLADARTVLAPAPMVSPALQQTRLATGNLVAIPAPLGSASMARASGPAIAATVVADPLQAGWSTSGTLALSGPLAPAMNTMRIATPHGYSSQIPRRILPVVLGAAVLLGVTGGLLSVTCFGRDAARDHAPSIGKTPGYDTAGVSPPGPGEVRATAPAATPAPLPPPATSPSSPSGATFPPGSITADEPPRGAASTSSPPEPIVTALARTRKPAPTFPQGATRRARLTIESVPEGATVKGPGGKLLGTTPLAIDWPASDVPVSFELKLGGYRAKHKRSVVNGNLRLVVELERAASTRRAGSGPSRPSRPSRAKPGNGKSGNGLMRPDD